HIHGGYWRRGRKEIFSCLGEGGLARGWAAALPGYTLAPDASLTQITKKLRTALDWFAAPATRSWYCRAPHIVWLVGRWASHGILLGSSTSGGRAGDFWRIRTCSAARLPPRQR